MKMNVRPIKTEADYDWALKEIARYFMFRRNRERRRAIASTCSQR